MVKSDCPFCTKVEKTYASFWSGPCGDSFCYASCDSPNCHSELRKGKTPTEHNAYVDAQHSRRIDVLASLYPGVDRSLIDGMLTSFDEISKAHCQ